MTSYIPAGTVDFSGRESGLELHLDLYKDEGEEDREGELLC